VTGEILFIQGGGAGVHDAWDNQLVGSLARELPDDVGNDLAEVATVIRSVRS
jgi:hypothetical protein